MIKLGGFIKKISKKELSPEEEFQLVYNLIAKDFDVAYYTSHYTFDKTKYKDSIEHYIIEGTALGYNPNPLFDTNYYLANNDDVRESGLNPFYHYLLHGKSEGRFSREISFEDNPENKAHIIKEKDEGIEWLRKVIQDKNKHIEYLESKLNESIKAIHPGRLIQATEYLKYQKTKAPKQALTEDKTQVLEYFLNSNERMVFPSFTFPRISIVIILYNRAELTFSCLSSILKNVSISYELIIVDNNSSDDTSKLLDKIDNATLIRNDENRHFLLANNQAFEKIRGDFTLLLNNDTIVTENSIENAFSAIIKDDSVGAVGAKLILPDGSLQEAGSIVWQNGSCLGYGRGDNPDNLKYAFRRNVDYCSGAFLLLRSDLLKKLDGFDDRFYPAYFEETDLCLRIWEAGYKVQYCPDVKVIHFEFASSGSQDNAIELQKKNREKFIKKHSKLLKDHYPPDISFIESARHSSFAKKKGVLFIDDMVPHKDKGSGFPRANQIVNLLSKTYHVSIVSLTLPVEDSIQDIYRDINKNIEVVENVDKDNIGEFLVNNLQNSFEIIWISRPHNMEFFQDQVKKHKLDLSNVRIIYDAEALYTLRDINRSKMLGVSDAMEKFNSKLKEELALASTADEIVVVNKIDKRYFEEYTVNNKIWELNIAYDANPTVNEFHERNDVILFVGNMDHDDSPNVDSIIWFTNNVLPLVKKKNKNVKLNLVGSNLSSQLKELSNNKSVEILGRVMDLTPLYDEAKVFIAPTRFAGGSPAKAFQAAALGLPMIVTDLLQSQLEWEEGKHLLAAKVNDHKTFANHVITLLNNRATWTQLRNNALELINSNYDTKSYEKELLKITKGQDGSS